ncbi:MAG: sugar ABC transporter permease [Solirubrobacterales bacterium]|nr:sugar ABC transporter permease [Solirubrobacterales bacterium]
MKQPAWRNAAMLAPAVTATVLLFGGALAGAVDQSFTPPLGGGLDSWSLDNWRSVFGDPVFGDALVFTLLTTAMATVLAALLALVIASLMRRGSSAARTAAAFPVPVPHMIVAVVAVLWLAPGGLADRVLGSLPINLVRDQAGLGIVLVYLFKETPFLVLLLLAVMGRRLDEQNEMAAVHGMGRWARLRWVIWPAVRVPLGIGSIIVTAFVFSAFEVPLAVGPNYPPTIGTYALEVTQTDAISGAGEAAAALLVGAAASIAFAVGILALASRQRRSDA